MRNLAEYTRLQEISIHALREEGDLFALLLHSKSAEISIHALRVEGDQMQRVRS